MKKSRKAIVVKDDGHIDPKVWFGRYGIRYESKKVTVSTNTEEFPENSSLNEGEKHMLKIRTSHEGLRRWQLGIQECNELGTKGLQRLELRLYVMKHGTAEGFQLKNFNDYQQIVEFYA